MRRHTEERVSRGRVVLTGSVEDGSVRVRLHVGFHLWTGVLWTGWGIGRRDRQ